MRIFVCAFLAVVSLGAMPAAALAQASFGIKGGLVRASVSTSGSAAFEAKARSGVAAGVFAGIELGGPVQLQPELLVSDRRFGVEGSPLVVRSRGIELPVLIHVRPGGARRVRPVLFAGPQLNFITRVTQSGFGEDRDISDDIANVDAGITIGGGFEVTAGRGAVVVDARANVGLQDLSRTGEPKLKSRGFLLLAGYRF